MFNNRTGRVFSTALALAGFYACGAMSQPAPGPAPATPSLAPAPVFSTPGAPATTGRLATNPTAANPTGRGPLTVSRATPLSYINPDIAKAYANKDYAWLLDYYGKKCHPGAVTSFKDAEEFAKLGQGAGNCYFLGELYRNGQGVPADLDKAMGYYQIAADGGYWPAVVTLALMHFKGQGVPKDAAKGLDLVVRYTTDARNSNAGACTGADLLAYLSIKGRYVAQSGAEAEKWYRYCLGRSDDPKARLPDAFVIHNLLLLADLYNDESLMPGHVDAAVQLYNRIVVYADGSHYREDAQPAQRALGQMYIQGRGVAKDPAKGIGLLKAAVNRSVTDPQSAVILYRLYSAGDVVPADPVQAASYLDIAVKAGWPEAQTIAAQNALNASPAQPDKAKALLMAAVVTGYAPAQHLLGDYYLKFGTPDNAAVNAYVWYDFATQNGDSDAGKARDDVAAKLPPGEPDKAKAAEAQIKARFPDVVEAE